MQCLVLEACVYMCVWTDLNVSVHVVESFGHAPQTFTRAME